MLCTHIYSLHHPIHSVHVTEVSISSQTTGCLEAGTMLSPPLLSPLPGAPCRVPSWSPGMPWVWALEAPLLTTLHSECPWAVFFLSFFFFFGHTVRLAGS